MDLVTILLIALLVGAAAFVPIILILLITLISNVNNIKKEMDKENNDSYAIPLSALRGMPMPPGMGPEDMKRAYAAYVESTGKPDDTKDAAHPGMYL